jgi:putative exosortase-associated protein (TIGR04073 family)
MTMLKTLSLLGAVALAAVISTGCAGPEKKLGRGFNNIGEVVRWGEMRRSVEQAGVWSGPTAARGTGLVSGFNKSLARIGTGIFEVATFPIPSYDPMFPNYLTPEPQFPDSYKPGLPETSIYDTDTALGFAGGDLLPIVPGSRFAVFRTP